MTHEMLSPDNERYDVNQLSFADLADYLQDHEAKGVAVLQNGKSVVELHEFEEDRTITWQTRQPMTLPENVAKLIATARLQTPVRSILLLSSFINHSDYEKSGSIHNEEKIPLEGLTDIDVQQHLLRFYSNSWENTFDIHLQIQDSDSLNDRDAHLSFWADVTDVNTFTAGVSAKKEIDVTQEISDLIVETSDQLSTADPNDLRELVSALPTKVV